MLWIYSCRLGTQCNDSVCSLIWVINDQIIVQIMKGIHSEFLIVIVELRSYWANLVN